MGFFDSTDEKKALDEADKLFYTPEQKALLDNYFRNEGKKKGGCMGGKSKRMTDAEYYAKVMEKKAQFDPYNRALAYLGIDEYSVREIPPVEFDGFLLSRENPLDKPVMWGDSELYTNIYESTWFFFGDTQFYVYRLVFDMLSGSVLDESREMFYKDVTSFAVIDLSEEVDNLSVKSGGCMGGNKVTNSKSIKKFMRFRIVVPGERSGNMDYVMTANEGLSAKIHAMKQKLREKKNNG